MSDKTYIVEVRKDFMDASISDGTFGQIATGVMNVVNAVVLGETGSVDAVGSVGISEGGRVYRTSFKGTEDVAEAVRKIENVHSVTEWKRP